MTFRYSPPPEEGWPRQQPRTGWSDLVPPHQDAGDRVFVAPSACESFLEDVPRFDPLLCLVVHCRGIRLEHDSLARAEQAGVHQGVETFRKFFLIVMSEFLMMKIDVHLRTSQRPIEFFGIFFVDTITDNGRHHKRAVENLSVSELFGKIHHASEQGSDRYFSIDEQFEALENHPTEVQFDLFTLQDRLEGLDRGVVASRLITDGDRARVPGLQRYQFRNRAPP